MRIFLAGATGVIGTRLIPLLVEDGHVAGMTHSAETVTALGAPSGLTLVADDRAS